MSTYVVSVDTTKLLEKFKRIPDAVYKSLARAVVRLAIDLQSHVKADKLTGQVLHVRTGTLRRSINQRVIQEPTAIWGSVGTNVKYARVHEYGFQGQVTVKAHLRTIHQAFGRPIKPVTFTMPAHARQVNLPERSFLRSALKDFEPRIRQTLIKAGKEGLTP